MESQQQCSMVDVGGRLLHAVVAGLGNPTVVLESGTGLDVRLWRKVLPELAQLTRVIAYDRAGVGGSQPAPAVRGSLQLLVDDLHALLNATQAPPPYVLVGHSLGGCLVRLFATQFPQLIAGLVLVDAMHEGLAPTGESWHMLCDWERFTGDWTAFIAPLLDATPSANPCYAALPPVPAVVLSCDWREITRRTHTEWHNAFRASHIELADSMPRASYRLVERSSHFIPRDQPAAVTDAIRTVIQAVRSGCEPASTALERKVAGTGSELTARQPRDSLKH